MAKKGKHGKTHFGFQEVPWDEKQKKVADVFHSVAAKYDVMNDLMSLGLHRLWKRRAIALSGAKIGDKVLDLAGGTGDLALKLMPLVGTEGRVVISDINSSMLTAGREKLEDSGNIGNIEYVKANAESLPFADKSFDCVTIAFGLRNVTDKQAALESIFRILKPAGKIIILEFSQVNVPGLKTVYDAYSFHVLPKIGKLIAKDEDSYRYLAESIRKHPNQDALKNMMEQAGFEDCEYYNLSGGIVAIHKGIKYGI